jgi:cystathionine gamma-synthase
MLFPKQKIAEQCRSFIERRSSSNGAPVNARLLHLFICPENKPSDGGNDVIAHDSVDLHIVLFPADSYPVAREFWQHVGQGISSRLAEKCLSLWPDDSLSSPSPVSNRFPFRGHNRHYSAVKVPCSPKSDSPCSPVVEDLSKDHSVYLEERYGRNLPLVAAAFAKRALRSRVAGVLKEKSSGCQSESYIEQKDLLVGPSTRGVAEVAVDDVYLYPSGMSAIWNAHNMALDVLPPAKSISFGLVLRSSYDPPFMNILDRLFCDRFPYTDTLKILQKWGPGCHFLGHGIDTDVDRLEIILEEEFNRNPAVPPVLALFTEFPSNPLLRSANLPRLRALADKYDFLIVIDETIGNFVNVEILPYADIVVSSLTKIFSGASNVMGGR